MGTTVRDMPDLERALLRRSVHDLSRHTDHCFRCGRSPLVGERIHRLADHSTMCELCRSVEHAKPVDTQVVHGPEFGHTLRVIDRRDVRRRAA